MVAGRVDLDGLGSCRSGLTTCSPPRRGWSWRTCPGCLGATAGCSTCGRGDEPTGRIPRGLAAAGWAGPAGVGRARPGRAARGCGWCIGPRKGRLLGSAGPADRCAHRLPCQRSRRYPPIPRLLRPAVVGDRPPTARPAGWAGCGRDRGRGRVPRAGMLCRRVNKLKHPGPAWRAGRPRRAPRGRPHPHLPGPSAGAEPDQVFYAVASTGPRRRRAAPWTAVVAGRRAGHAGRRAPRVRDEQHRTGLRPALVLGPHWSPSAPDPGGQRTNRRAGACSITARERGPSCAPALGDLPTIHRRHLRHGLRNGGCRHDVQP
jgi:hypothetical protein